MLNKVSDGSCVIQIKWKPEFFDTGENKYKGWTGTYMCDISPKLFKDLEKVALILDDETGHAFIMALIKGVQVMLNESPSSNQD